MNLKNSLRGLMEKTKSWDAVVLDKKGKIKGENKDDADKDGANDDTAATKADKKPYDKGKDDVKPAIYPL